MSNTRFYIFILIVLSLALQIRATLFGSEQLFEPVMMSVFDSCVSFTHAVVASLATSYTPITIVVIFAIYMPLQSAMLDKIASLAYPKYKELSDLRKEDPDLSVSDAIAICQVSRQFVCIWPFLKIVIHITFFYLFLYPMVTLSPAISFDTTLLYGLIVMYWLVYLLGNWKTLHKAYKQMSFHVSFAITILMIFLFPHALSLYFVVSAMTELLITTSQRVLKSDEQKTTTQPIYR
jgi:hypothetical protein